MPSALLKLTLLTCALALAGCDSLGKRPVPPSDTKAEAPMAPAPGLAPRLVQALSLSQPLATSPSMPVQLSAAE